MEINEAQLKKKLQLFLADMPKLGTVKGFKYFAMYLRGREELVLSVVNNLKTGSSAYTCAVAEKPPPDQRTLSKSESFSSTHLPYDQRSLMLSIRSQMIASTHKVKDVGLPPASPSEEESVPADDNSTLFLIAGYSRYSCPYVWVRSNHERLVKLTGDSSNEKDCPLKLKTTTKWAQQDIYLWDIIAELVKLCTYPAPRNPFAIDFDYFTLLPLQDQVLATAAMVTTLQRILMYSPDQKPYSALVFEELQLISKQHFSALEKLAKQGGLPILQQQQQQQQKQQQQRSQLTSRSRTSSYNNPSQPGYGYGSQQVYGGPTPTMF